MCKKTKEKNQAKINEKLTYRAPNDTVKNTHTHDHSMRQDKSRLNEKLPQ